MIGRGAANLVRFLQVPAALRAIRYPATPAMSYFTSTRTVLPDGAYPTMITPMKEGGAIDWDGLDLLTEWYIRSGVAGIFSVCLSSEMFQLTNTERVSIVERVSTKAAGRVPVVAGATFEGGLEEQAKLMNEVAKAADVVVIITNQIGDMTDTDDEWIRNVEQLMERTGDVPLGFYETPMPKVRSLSPAVMEWAAKSGRFYFHKDTSLTTAMMLEKMRVVQGVRSTPLKFFTAKVPLLKVCLDNGGNGFSGIALNFFPWLIAWICRNKSDTTGRLQAAMRFVSLVDGTVARRYPTSAKYYLASEYGAPLESVSRAISDAINDQDRMSLHCIREEADLVCERINVSPVDISTCL